jgi:HlyD family secretion protein
MLARLKKLKARLGRKFWVILIILVVVAGFFIFRSRQSKPTESSKIERGLVKEELILTGSVNAEKYASLSFPTSGKIAWVSAKEGQSLKRGQWLLSLDTTTLNAAYQQSLNAYRNYQATAEQVLDSVKGHSGDETFAQKATRTTAEANRDSSYNAMLAAKYNLDNAIIRAPFDGVLSSLPFSSPGVNISLTDVAAVVVDPSTIYFDVDADQNDVTSLKVSQSVTMVLDSYQDKEMLGTVSFISITPKVGVSGTTYKVKIIFSGEDAFKVSPRIGMTGDAKFVLSQKESTLFVPSEYVKSDTKGKYLKVGEPKNKTYVETGLESEERIEILSNNIKEGDTVYE